MRLSKRTATIIRAAKPSTLVSGERALRIDPAVVRMSQREFARWSESILRLKLATWNDAKRPMCFEPIGRGRVTSTTLVWLLTPKGERAHRELHAAATVTHTAMCECCDIEPVAFVGHICDVCLSDHTVGQRRRADKVKRATFVAAHT